MRIYIRDLRRSYLGSFNNKEYKRERISPLTIISIVVLVTVMAFFLVTEDSGGREAIKWLLALFVLSALFRPCLSIKWLRFWDDGFGLSFGLGLALSFFAAWLLSVCNICAFDTPLIIIVTLILGVLANVVSKRNKIIGHKWNQRKAERYLWGFAVFSLIFLFAFWVIGFNPGVDSGTENYMDFGFMQGIYRQKMVAPFDVWMSGEKLNYYYLGQAAAVFLCRLAFTTPEFGYNFMLCTFWGMTFVMTGEIAYAVVRSISENSFRNKKYGSHLPERIAGVTAAVFTAFGANGHWLIYGIIVPALEKISGSEIVEGNYWFPEPTVYISTFLGDPDNGKNEFPAYSAVLGDLHAHVLNVIFVLPLIAIMLDYAFSKDEKKSYINLGLTAILLGLFKGSNYWDFAIYFVITGAIVVFCDIRNKGWSLNAIKGIAIKALVVTAISNIVILPFTISFNKMASTLFIATNHSPLIKMVVLWLIPFVITVFLVLWLTFSHSVKIITPSASREGLIALMLCTLGLVITPEILYIQDIYGEENARFNTMFKLTYQAFILFGIIIGIAAGIAFLQGIMNQNSKDRQTRLGNTAFLWGTLVVFITVLLSTYTIHAIGDWFGNVFNKDYRRSISSLETLYSDPDYYYEMLAKDILDDDERPVINIVETAGDSYTHESALSILSGACAPVGWYVHEWMWRDDPDIVQRRGSEVAFFYECGDEGYCRDFINKYDIDYIFVGPAELNKYDVISSGFDNVGEILLDEDSEYGRIMLIRVNKQ